MDLKSTTSTYRGKTIDLDMELECAFQEEINTSLSPLTINNITPLSPSQHDLFEQIILNYEKQIAIIKAQLLRLIELRTGRSSF